MRFARLRVKVELAIAVVLNSYGDHRDAQPSFGFVSRHRIVDVVLEYPPQQFSLAVVSIHSSAYDKKTRARESRADSQITRASDRE